jgi:hypothetical protein
LKNSKLARFSLKRKDKAQLFGICCEGMYQKYNYLIDEEHFLEKNANTVISL